MFLDETPKLRLDRLAFLNSSSFTLNRRQMLPLEPNCLWQIEAGFVRSLTSDEDATLTTLGFWKIGDLVGLPTIDIRPYWVECLTPVKVTRLLTDTPAFQDTLVVQMHCAQIHQAQELLRIAHYKRVESRLLKLLNWLARLIGEKQEDGYFIPLRLTHQDLADTVGTTRVTVTRLVNEFQRSGLIRDLNQGYFLRRINIK